MIIGNKIWKLRLESEIDFTNFDINEKFIKNKDAKEKGLGNKINLIFKTIYTKNVKIILSRKHKTHFLPSIFFYLIFFNFIHWLDYKSTKGFRELNSKFFDLISTF